MANRNLILDKNIGNFSPPDKGLWQVRKKMAGIFVSLVLSVFFSVPALAQNRVDRMDIYATIQEDGSMDITQIWDGTFTEGTENYIPMNAPDYLTISGLRVADSYGPYETVDEWDVAGSFEEKVNRCGVYHTGSGYEICFGISRYGKNQYTLTYRLDNVVAGYDDADGVNFRFVNDDMNTTPTDARVEIRLWDDTPITAENADTWAFGFDGQVEFSHGAIVAYTKSPINRDNHLTVMFALDKGILTPDRTEDVSFETVKEEAFVGSRYDSGDDDTGLLVKILACIVGGLIAMVSVFLLCAAIEKKKMRAFIDKTGYFRFPPNQGDINATYALGRAFLLCSGNSIVEANILSLIASGCITPMTEETAVSSDKAGKAINLRLNEAATMSEYEERLYLILKCAAGKDEILKPKKLKQFITTHHDALRGYIDSCVAAGNAYLERQQCMKSWKLPSKIKYLTPSGEKELRELIGYRKYLQDYSRVAERELDDLSVYQEQLSHAVLFGIADKLVSQLKELYPSISEELDAYTSTMYTAHMYNHLLYSNMMAAETRQRDSECDGGAASFGGGGGSIGGGSGGGSR